MAVGIFCIACSHSVQAQKRELNYMRNGVSFSLPAEWQIISNDSISKNAFYFSAERSEKKGSGLITVVWMNKVENPVEVIKLHQKTMKASNTYRNPGIEFTENNSLKFSGYPALQCQYLTFVKEKKINGKIICMNSNTKTITIFYQTEERDQSINHKGFELFERTFNIRD